MTHFIRILLIMVLLGGGAEAQYRTESWELPAGWSGIYLNIDPGEVDLDTLLAGQPDITEIWQWRPGGLDPSLNPAEAQETGADEWKVWRRGDRVNSTFLMLSPHAAYTVFAEKALTMSLRGLVVPPRVHWRTDGSNLLGFPTAGSRPLPAYLAASGIVGSNTEIYRYVGGPINDSNPGLAPAHLLQIRRGEALWIRSHKFSDFYGPLSVEVALDSGLHFKTNTPHKRLVLRNRTGSEMTVNLAPRPSEPAPGQAEAPLAPTLLVRERDEATGLYAYGPLGANLSLTIPARESVGVTLSVDRRDMPGEPGDPFAGLLQVTDGAGLSEIYLPVTAKKASLAGLWMGEAQILQVQNQLQRFQRDADGNYLVDDQGKHIPEYEKDSNGEIIRDGEGNPIPVRDVGLNATAQEFKLRLLMHVNSSGAATLLSRVYSGVVSDDGVGNLLMGLTTEQSLLHSGHLKTAVRLSSATFPKGMVQGLSGSYEPGGALTGTVVLGANHPTNPFLHIYHPDHDNKDARFKNVLSPGIESHTVERAITLTVNSGPLLGEGPQWGASLLSGSYAETISGLHKNPIAVAGIFALSKVSDIGELRKP